jgi:phage terminase large subunit
VQLDLPSKFQPLFKPKRFKIYYGGRGAAKTVSFAKTLLFMAAQERKRVLCLREFMNSIEDSVHGTLKDEVATLNMGPHFEVQKTQIIGANDSLFKYAALSRNIASIKSKHAFDIAWIEEGENVSERSWETLEPTMRASGSEIWVSFNPDDEFGFIYSKFVKPYLDEIESNGFYEDESLLVVKVNLVDNPFAPQELLDSSARMKKADYKKWLHIWDGQPYGDYSDSIIQPEWVDAAIDAHLKLGFKGIGVKSLGFDPADTGSDAKAVMMRHGSVITKGRKWSDGELPEAIDIAFADCYEWRGEFIVYDADGLGVGVKVGLAPRIEGKNIEVIPYHGGGSVDNPLDIYADDKTNKDTFRNKRAQYYWQLRDRLEATYNAIHKGIYTDPQDMISLSSDLPDLDVLKSELIKIQRAKRRNNFIQIESKEDMKARGVKSPNMADALVMCFANPAPAMKAKDINFNSEF